MGELTKISDPAVVARIKADVNLLTFAGGVAHQGRRYDYRGGGRQRRLEPSAKDEECALAGLEKIKDRLE